MKLKTFEFNKYSYILITLIFIVKVIYILILNMPLSHEEAYYWCYAKHPDLSYFDHPAMTAWIIAIFTSILGDNEFAVRISSALLSLGTNLLVYESAKKLYNEKIGFYSVVVLNLTFVYNLYSTYITPDTPLLFFWALSFYLFLKACEKNNFVYWGLSGISMGCALLSKYTAIFLPLSLLIMAIILKDYRKYIAGLLFSFAIALITFSPAIIWNQANDFVSFRFQSSDRFASHEFHWDYVGGFLALQALYITPLIMFGYIYSFICILRKNGKVFADWTVLFTSVPMFLFFVLISPITWSKPNWTAPILITGLILTTAVYSAKLSENNNKITKMYTITAVIFAILLNMLFYIQPLWPQILPPLSKANSMAGWDTLGQKVTQIRDSMPKGRYTFLAGNGYQIASELQFYSAKKGEQVYSCDIFSQPALQYDFWKGDRKEKWNNAVFVTSHFIELDEALLNKYFVSYEEAEPYDVIVAGEKIRTFRIFKCYGYKGI